jgi:cytochrome b involved in lipid metabolism
MNSKSVSSPIQIGRKMPPKDYRKSSRAGMQAEVERLRSEIETLKAAEQGFSMRNYSIQHQDPRSSNGVFKISKRGLFSKVIWLLIFGGVVFGIFTLINFMNENGIRFTRGEAGNTLLTISEVALHNKAEDCYVIYHGSVYDQTSYAKRHPGGSSIITNLCGTDGTTEYDRFHSVSLLASVEGNMIGPLSIGEEETTGMNDDGQSQNIINDEYSNGSTLPPLVFNNYTISLAELQQHSSQSNCWVAYYGSIYDMTDYANRHPAGSRIITRLCGMDGTNDFKMFHSPNLLNILRKDELKGILVTDGAVTSTPSPTPGSTPASTPKSTSSPTPFVTPTPEFTSRPTMNSNDGITMAELQQHSSKSDCWVVYYRSVYDMTYYAKKHPGGAGIITKLCGQDGTTNFEIFHSSSLLNILRNGEWRGPLNNNNDSIAFVYADYDYDKDSVGSLD